MRRLRSDAVIDLLTEQVSASAGEIADRLGLEPSIAADCLRSLLAEEIVTAEDTGSGRVYRLRG